MQDSLRRHEVARSSAGSYRACWPLQTKHRYRHLESLVPYHLQKEEFII